jgi:AbrB family looped-hinge helix DNA binding protein
MAVAAGRLSSKGQIVIPKRLRDKLSLKEDDDLIIVAQGDLLLIKKLTLEDIIKETDRQYRAGEILNLDEAFKDILA